MRIAFPILLIALAAGSARAQSPAAAPQPLRTDADARYVHRLTLYDHDGKAIDPAAPDAAPYSPRATCGKCHEYGTISHGWHFNAAQAGANPGRAGEPWIFTDPRIGTQIPLSYRSWPGTFTPEQIGLSRFQFTKQFGRHMPGGGLGETDPSDARPGPDAARWSISGALEIDCLICHSADNSHDPAEHARQLEVENFKWAPTAAAGLATIRGEAKKLPDDVDPAAPPSPDHPERAAPTVVYNKARFDADNRVVLDVTRNPGAERCYYCHSTRAVGAAAQPHWLDERDIHLSAGMSCSDCHRGGIDHLIARGDGVRYGAGPEWGAAVFSCVGCHCGEAPPVTATASSAIRASASAPAAAASQISERPSTGLTSVPRANRHGAPHPQHIGLPNIHFEKLTCTACHSGPYPESRTSAVQTSLNHALGVPTKQRRATDWPRIVEPVFVEHATGQIGPHRLILPSFFARYSPAGYVPIPIDQVRKAVPKAPASASAATGDRGFALPRATIRAALENLTSARKPSAGELIVYVSDSHAWAIGPNGELTDQNDAYGGSPPLSYSWPIAHNVRPASQALGARGCADCHDSASPIFHGKVAAELAGTFDGSSAFPGSRDMAVFQANGDPLIRESLVRSLGAKLVLLVLGWISALALLGVLVRNILDALMAIARR